jgi:hypothetical protein
MPDIHVPHLDEEEGEKDENDENDEREDAVPRRPRPTWKSFLKIGLEVALIGTGVFLGLAGEQWRENVRHRELAHASLQRFRAEFRANRAEVLRVKDRHAKEVQDLEAYFNAHSTELLAHLVDLRKPIPSPVPDNVTDSAGFNYAAWDLALATQSLAYIDPDLVATMSSTYRLQQLCENAHNWIAQASYSGTNVVYLLGGRLTYFGDTVLYEQLLLKQYDDILPRLDNALGDPPRAK